MSHKNSTMKTSIKLILALFATIVLISLSSVIMARIYAEKAKKQKLLPVIVKTKSQTTLEKRVDYFNEVLINVYGKISYIQSDTEKIVIKTAKRSTLFNIQYEVRDSMMIITRMDTVSVPVPVEIILYSDSINSVQVKTPASFTLNNLRVSMLKCRIKAGLLQGVVKAGELDLTGTDSASYSISGTAEKLRMNGMRYSEFNMNGCEAGDAIIVGNTNSRFEVRVRDTIYFDLSNDCKLDYAGAPAFINLNINQEERFGKIDQFQRQ